MRLQINPSAYDFRPSPMEPFDLFTSRTQLCPRLSRRELARKMAVSPTYIKMIEKGYATLTPARLAQVQEIIASWQTAPNPFPRKPRKDIGKKHRKFRKPRKPIHMVSMPIPEPERDVAFVS